MGSGEWKEMLENIKKAKEPVDDDYEKMNGSASRKELEDLNEKADGSLQVHAAISLSR